MAERRMLSKKIVESDAFLDMPPSAQALYMHLNMAADDDGIVNAPKRVQRTCGAADDDLKLLQAKGFVIAFESGVIVVKHWRINNYIPKDRYHQTEYLEELGQLYIKPNNAYTLEPSYTSCIQAVYKSDTEISIDKNRLSNNNARTREKNKYFSFPQREYTEQDLEALSKNVLPSKSLGERRRS